jgi:hypothetical protein
MIAEGFLWERYRARYPLARSLPIRSFNCLQFDKRRLISIVLAIRSVKRSFDPTISLPDSNLLQLHYKVERNSWISTQ